MNFSLHERSQGRVNPAMPGQLSQPGELRRYDQKIEMTSARGCAGVTDVLPGVILELYGFRVQDSQPFAYRGGKAHFCSSGAFFSSI